ncbi:NUDIX hydrolase [Vibrio sp. B1Z05]|uniref:NUDIX hydrolase n=1 Tax=Vibrio sp. B1Z05 TaxID=2654980 RepID=UPI00128DB757|nr:NUDIX hydrolase [Vibrio sp. B1Z05]MPW36420.1 NUDIX domain-containing protein [Vibrio sp. B1Z05]
MRHLTTRVHPSLSQLDQHTIIQRQATRAIALRGEQILLMYTERYHDYSLPGGGLDEGEDVIEGLVRELQEETGAQNIRNIAPFGVFEEFRPWYKNDADVMHMHSYCYTCQVDPILGTPNFEEYEINNGMQALWVNIYDAIRHNEHTMATSDKKGLSIERETFLLHLIAQELL